MQWFVVRSVGRSGGRPQAVNFSPFFYSNVISYHSPMCSFVGAENVPTIFGGSDPCPFGEDPLDLKFREYVTSKVKEAISMEKQQEEKASEAITGKKLSDDGPRRVARGRGAENGIESSRGKKGVVVDDRREGARVKQRAEEELREWRNEEAVCWALSLLVSVVVVTLLALYAGKFDGFLQRSGMLGE